VSSLGGRGEEGEEMGETEQGRKLVEKAQAIYEILERCRVAGQPIDRKEFKGSA
jgi:hypothetical protein